MRTISEIMARDPATILPSDSLAQAIRLMNDRNTEAVPVCVHERLVGILTKTDLAEQLPMLDRSLEQIAVSAIMVHRVFCCFEDQSVQEALGLMSGREVRQLPVLDRSHKLVGIVSLDDLSGKIGESIIDKERKSGWINTRSPAPPSAAPPR